MPKSAAHGKGVHGAADHGLRRTMNGRATQLDGLRAVAMLAICWDHWRPPGWPRLVPFEVFLFFFLVMTGYLITGSLLRERGRAEARGGPWRAGAMRVYQIRRGLRILAPYYAALALALVVWAPDIWPGLPWYVLHLSNIHMAFLPDWPQGTNHFWSLSMQQQFYLFWPFVVWFVPRRWLPLAMVLVAAAGPVTRSQHDVFSAWCVRPDVLTWACLDYFAIGGLLALAQHRGMSLESPGLRWLALLAAAGYLALFGGHELGMPTFGLRCLQQTLLSIALCGFIAAAGGPPVGAPVAAGNRAALIRRVSLSQSGAAAGRQAAAVFLVAAIRHGVGRMAAGGLVRGSDVGAHARLLALDRAALARGAPAHGPRLNAWRNAACHAMDSGYRLRRADEPARGESHFPSDPVFRAGNPLPLAQERPLGARAGLSGTLDLSASGHRPQGRLRAGIHARRRNAVAGRAHLVARTAHPGDRLPVDAAHRQAQRGGCRGGGGALWLGLGGHLPRGVRGGGPRGHAR
jgi:peptidoglycan/LPS O-acetylase OafA/YrhL